MQGNFYTGENNLKKTVLLIFDVQKSLLLIHNHIWSYFFVTWLEFINCLLNYLNFKPLSFQYWINISQSGYNFKELIVSFVAHIHWKTFSLSKLQQYKINIWKSFFFPFLGLTYLQDVYRDEWFHSCPDKDYQIPSH